MTESQVDEFQRRQIALDQAVKTHGNDTAAETVKAAQAYLAFLKGEEVGRDHGQDVQHHPV